MSGRVLVMGDIHGNLHAFDQCMVRSGFDYEHDLLIQLGDVSDRFPDTARIVERLLTIKHLIALRGNHDLWTNQWILSGIIEPSWLANGGQATIDSYEKSDLSPFDHKEFFSLTQINYHIDTNNRIFVHGGFRNSKGPVYDPNETDCLWDRSLWNEAIIGQKISRKPEILTGFEEIYIGHTPTLNWLETEPMNIFNVWNLDTGAGHPGGRLTIMDVDSKEFWQSDISSNLYP